MLNNRTSLGESISQTLAINRAFYGWGHRFLYSKELLNALMESAGFDEIMFFEYGKSNNRNLLDLERHGGWAVNNEFPSVWIVEGVKSEKPTQNALDQYHINQKFLNHVASGH